MLLHSLEVILESRRSPVSLQQAAETPELVGELRRAVGRSLLEVIDAEECVVIEARLPEERLDSLLCRERLLLELCEQPCVLLIPEARHALMAAGNPDQVKSNFGKDVNVVSGIEPKEVPESSHVNVAVL